MLRQVGALVGVGIAQRLAASQVATMVKQYFFRRDPTTGLVQNWPGRANMGSQHARLTMLTETTRSHVQATLYTATRDRKLVEFRLSAGHIGSDQCDGYARGGPYTPGSAPTPPVHPRCRCWLQVVDPISGRAA